MARRRPTNRKKALELIRHEAWLARLHAPQTVAARKSPHQNWLLYLSPAFRARQRAAAYGIDMIKAVDRTVSQKTVIPEKN